MYIINVDTHIQTKSHDCKTWTTYSIKFYSESCQWNQSYFLSIHTILLSILTLQSFTILSFDGLTFFNLTAILI